MTGVLGGSTARAANAVQATAACLQVQASLSIRLRSLSRSAPSPSLHATAVAGQAAGSSTILSSARTHSAAPSTSSSGSANDAAAALPAAAHTLHVKVTGLLGLEQELTSVTGHTEEIFEEQWQDVYNLPLPEQQLLTVDEQLIRNWAAAGGQLQVNVTVNPIPETNITSIKKAAGSAPAKGVPAAAVPTPVAAGTLQLNCAGLLVGDASATYNWVQSSFTPSSAAEEAAGTQSLQEGAQTNSAAVVSSAGCAKQKLVMQPPDGNLAVWLGSAEVQLHIFKVPVPETAIDCSSAKAAAVQQNSTSGVSAKASKPAANAPATAVTAGAVLMPCSLLTPDQAAVYNPVVVYAYKAADLPDAPATQAQLHQQCEAIRIKALWPPLVSGFQQAAAHVGGWSRSSSPPGTSSEKSNTSGSPHGSGSKAPSSSRSSPSTFRAFPAPAVRTVLFARPVVFLGSDAGTPEQLLQQCRQQPLLLQVHDRTAKPEPSEYSTPTTAAATAADTGVDAGAVAVVTLAGKATASAPAAAAAAPPAVKATISSSSSRGVASQSSEGEVFGVASVSLLDLARGASYCKFAVPLCPASTVRGAASLDWKRRPGSYMQANSVLKGYVRTAVPLHKMVTAEVAAAATAASAAATIIPVGQAAASRRLSATGVASAAATPTPSAALGNNSNNKPPARMSAAQAKLLQQQQAERQQQELLEQQAAAELQRQLLEQQAKERLPQPSAYVALPPDVRYPGKFTRAVFLFDYRDSDFFHTLEDTVRQHNAIALGLAPPPPPTAEEIAAAKAAAAAAAAEAAAVAAAAAAAAASPLQSRLSTAASRVAAARSSIAPGSAAAVGAKAGANRASVVAGAAGSSGVATAASATAGKTSAAAAAGIATASKLANPADNTPRSILRPSAAGQSNAASVIAGSSTQQQQHGRARFARVSELGDSDSESDSDCSIEGEVTESELRLRAALRRYDHVVVDARLLQGLSTAQLTATSADEPNDVDVLTGFHLVDGALRCVVLEGLATGTGMAVTVLAIARWALEDQQQQQHDESAGREEPGPQWLPRRVMYNPTIKCGDRLYSSLGVDLWMIKLKATLSELGAQATTYASGRVRPQCIAAMESLLGLTYGYRPPPGASSSNNSCGKLEQVSPAATAGTGDRHVLGNVTCSQATTSRPTVTSKPPGALLSTRAEGRLTSKTTASVVPAGGARAITAAGGAVNAAAGLVGCKLGRLVDELRLLPTAAQLQLVDKKFGGELTKADVLGVEADELDTEDEADERQEQQKHHGQQQQTNKPHKQQQELSGAHATSATATAASAKLMALLGAAAVEGALCDDAGAKSLKSGRSRRSRGSHNSKSRKSHNSSHKSSSKRRSRRRAKHALDMDNEVYLHLRLEAQRRRQQRDLTAEHEQLLHELQMSKQHIRDCWATWNPQRAAAQQLEEAIAAGTLTLEDTIKAWSGCKQAQPPVPVTIIERGWCPHDKPFQWPAPRDSATYNQHPLKPSEYRIQELDEPWQEGVVHEELSLGKSLGNGPGFNSLVHGTSGGLFTTDPAFCKTVHLGGDCWEEELAAAKAAAKADWAAKVVVKDAAMHVIPGTANKASAQADKYVNLLKGEPVKKGFKVAQVPAAPVSMYALDHWQGPTATVLGTGGNCSSSPDGMALGPTSATQRITSAERSKWIGGRNFDALGNRSRSEVAKPGFSDAATAAMHDGYYMDAD